MILGINSLVTTFYYVTNIVSLVFVILGVYY